MSTDAPNSDPTFPDTPNPATRSISEPGDTGSLADPTTTIGSPSEGTGNPASPDFAMRYQLGAELAHGGMGYVYRAIDTVLDREVAVKILAAKYSPESSTARRFLDEARIMGQLQHPNIPAVHDLGLRPDGRPFLAMKLIRGETLDQLLKKRPRVSTDTGRFVAIFEQICQAMAYSHAQGILHRDLKPSNIMVGAFGEVQVMDWGLAKKLTVRVFTDSRDDHPESTDSSDHSEQTRDYFTDKGSHEELTRAGQIMGTPAYLPPEQARGEIDQVDRRD